MAAAVEEAAQEGQVEQGEAMKEVAGAAERVGTVAAEMERAAEGMAVEAAPPGSAVVVREAEAV